MRPADYSGETEWTDTLIDVAEDAALFVMEAHFFAGIR